MKIQLFKLKEFLTLYPENVKSHMKGFDLPLAVVSMLSSCMTEVLPFNAPWWNFAASHVSRLMSEQISPWMSKLCCFLHSHMCNPWIEHGFCEFFLFIHIRFFKIFHMVYYGNGNVKTSRDSFERAHIWILFLERIGPILLPEVFLIN